MALALAALVLGFVCGLAALNEDWVSWDDEDTTYEGTLFTVKEY